MSHHYSGPDFGFPRGDARLDLTDLYAGPLATRYPKIGRVGGPSPSKYESARGPGAVIADRC
jgi:hypothetical protein